MNAINTRSIEQEAEKPIVTKSERVEDIFPLPHVHIAYIGSVRRSREETITFPPSEIVISNDLPTYGSATIHYESDPNRSASYSVLKVQRNQLLRRKREILKQLGDDAWKAMVKRYASTRQIRKWTGEYRVTKRLKPIYSKVNWVTKWLSKRDYLLLRAKQAKSAEERARYQNAAEYIKANPSLDKPMYKRVTVAEGSGLLTRPDSLMDKVVVPRMKVIRITPHDWTTIRRRWTARRKRVHDEISKIDTQLEQIRKKMLSLSLYAGDPAWNRCICVHNLHSVLAGELPLVPRTEGVNPKDYLRIRPHIGQYGLPKGTPDEGGSFLIGSDRKPFLWYSDQWIHPQLAPISQMSDDLFLTILEQAISTSTGAVYQEYSNWDALQDAIADNMHPVYDLKAWQYQQSSGTYQRTGEHSSSGTVARQQLVLESPQCVDLAPRVVHLDNVEQLEADFWDKFNVNLQKLQALDLPDTQRKLVFNMTRSLAEQKDTPETVRACKEFYTFIRGLTGREVYQVTTDTGRKLQFVSHNGMDAFQRRAVNLANMNASQRARALKTKPLGIVRVFKRKLTLATSLATAASVYLTYKFGIAPTVHDSRLVHKWGWDVCNRMRRGLDQLVSHLDAAREFHIFRRQWRVRSPVIDASARQQKQYVETGLGVTTEYGFTDEVDFTLQTRKCFGDQSGIDAAEMTTTGESGLMYLCPSYKIKDTDKEYVRQLELYNNDQLQGSILKRYFPDIYGRAYIRQDLRGCVFAKFSWKHIFRALRVDTKASLLSRSRFVETAWELLPLSFVNEWWTNLMQRVQAAQALLDQATAKLHSIGKPWFAISSRVWGGYVSPKTVNATVYTETVKTGMVACGNFVQSDASTGKIPYSVVAHSVPTKIKIHWHFEVEQEDSCLIRRASHLYRFFRSAVQGKLNTIPDVRVRLNLNAGKLGSLLALLLSRRN